MNITQGSRYAAGPALHDQATGHDLIGTRVPIDLPPADDDFYLTPTEREQARPDLLAYRAWGEWFGEAAADLYWIIFDLPDNGLLNPFAPLPAGVELRFPSAARVSFEVLGG